MFQLSFGMMEFWINGLLDLFIIPVFQHSNIPFYQDQNILVPEF